MNKYNGEVAVSLGGNEYKLVFDWEAIACVTSQLGNDAFQRCIKSPNPSEMSKILECGLKKHHPEMTADAIMKLSPAILPTLGKIDQAVAFAYFGVDADEAKEPAEVEQAEKKTQ